MKDLTRNSISRHILVMAAPLALVMITQIAYRLVSLYFVTDLGVAAVAGITAAGNIALFIGASTQVLGVGTAALVARATGRGDSGDANLIFNQAIVLSTLCGVLTALLLGQFIRLYMQWVAADQATIEAGTLFIYWLTPGYALLFPWSAIAYALRGTGIVQVPTIIYMTTVVMNAVLAPILIAGWGTGAPLGVMGAGMATSISVAVGVILLSAYCHFSQRYLAVQIALLKPQAEQWRRMLRIGLPAGSELVLTFLSGAVVYYVIRGFGSSAQAGFGIGSQILQTILLPSTAIAMAVAPIGGQNFGAQNFERVRETFRRAAFMVIVVSLAITLLVQWRASLLVNLFDADESAMTTATLFLQIMSWTLMGQGLVYVCSNMFQGLSNTVPSLLSAVVRFVAFVIPALWLSTQADFRVEHVWYALGASIVLQAIVSFSLLRLELSRRLSAPARASSAPASAQSSS